MITSQFYKANYRYILGNVFIREYDLAKANISALYEAGVIDEEQYQSYVNMDKNEREIEIGCYMKAQPELIDVMYNKIKEAREQFINSNNILDEQILYIDNDSITVIDRDLNINRLTHFSSKLDFILKNTYTIMLRLGQIHFLYSAINKNYRLKYANTSRLAEFHKDGFLDFLLELAEELYAKPLNSAINMVRAYNDLYVDKQLPINHYREFNNRSEYRLANKSVAYDYYSNVHPIDLSDIDISFNANLLRELMKILTTEYFRSTH